jgi:hypothetical protein
VHEAEETAKQILARNAQVLQDLANSLMRSETLSGPSLDVYMEAVSLWPEPLIKELSRHAAPIALQPDPDDALIDHRGLGEPYDDADTLWDSE